MLFCSVDRVRYKIQIPLPPKIDPSVTMMQVCADIVHVLALCIFVIIFPFLSLVHLLVTFMDLCYTAGQLPFLCDWLTFLFRLKRSQM